MALKLYYDINTTQFLAKTEEETWEQGDSDITIKMYFGTLSGDVFTNGLTNTTIYDQTGSLYIVRADDTTATVSASQVENGSEGYYKITSGGDTWITNIAGTLELTAKRSTTTATTSYGLATREIDEGAPSPDEGYATKLELSAVEDKVDANTTAKYNKSAITTTTAEGEPTVNTEVYSEAKTDELLALNSTTDQAYTDTVTNNILNGTTPLTKVSVDDGSGNVVDVTYVHTNGNNYQVLQATYPDGRIAQIDEELYINFRNETGVTLNSGAVLMSDTVSTGNQAMKGLLFDETSEYAENMIGVVTVDGILANAKSKVTSFGIVTGVSTTNMYASGQAYAEGDILYARDGKLSNVAPSKPATIVKVGCVINLVSTNADVLVCSQVFRKLTECNDVEVTTIQNRDLLLYESSTELFKNVSLDTELADLFKNVTYATDTHILTFTQYDDTTITVDLPLESAIVSASYDNATKDLTFTLQSGSTLTVPLDDIISGLASEDDVVQRDLSGFTEDLSLGGSEKVYIEDGTTPKRTTVDGFATYIGSLSGTVINTGKYYDKGLGAHDTAFVITPTFSNTANSDLYYNLIDTSVITDFYASSGIDKVLRIKVPSTLADDDTDARLSIDNGTAYYNLQINGGNIKGSVILGKELTVKWTGSVWEILDVDLLTDQLTFSKIVDSTLGETSPIKGVSKFIEADSVSLEQVLSNGDFSDGTTDWFKYLSYGTISISNDKLTYTLTTNNTSERLGQLYSFKSGVTYVVYIGEIQHDITTFSLTTRSSSLSNLVDTITVLSSETDSKGLCYTFTASADAEALGFNMYGSIGQSMTIDNVMVIPIANTPLASESADTIASRLAGVDYWEDRKDTVNPKWITRGNNLFDKDQYTNVDYAYKIEVKPSTQYTWAESIAYKIYDVNETELSSGTASAVTTDSNAYYIAFANTIADTDTFSLNEGGTLLDYDEFNEGYLELLGTGYSVGTSQDKFVETETGYAIQRYNSRDYNDKVKSATGWTVDLELTNTIRFYKPFSAIGLEAGVASDLRPYSILKIDSTKFSYGNTSTEDAELHDISPSGNLLIRIDKSKLSGITSADFEAYLQANNVEFIYELDSLEAPEDIEFNGTPIQEEITEIIQSNDNVAIDTTFEFNIDESALTLTTAKKTRKNRKDIDDAEVQIATNEANILLKAEKMVDILTTSANVSASATQPASANVSLDETYNNYDFVMVVYSEASNRYGSLLIPTSAINAGKGTYLTLANLRTDTGEQNISFYLVKDTTDATKLYAYQGRYVSEIYSPYSKSASSRSTIDIENIIGIKL